MLKCHAALGPLANMPVSLQRPWHFVPELLFYSQCSYYAAVKKFS